MQSIETPAFVLRSTPLGESHRIVLLATPVHGAVSAVARHGRKSLRRFPGALDYFKLIDVSLTRKSRNDELWQLGRARLVHYYRDAVTALPRYYACCWAVECYRTYVPREMEDPQLFAWLRDIFDYFESRDPAVASLFASFVRLLRLTGNLPSFDRCVVCGREAPDGASAYFDPQAGGLLCRKCGGRKNLLAGPLRRFLVKAAAMESLSEMDDMDGGLVEAASSARRLLFNLMDEIGSIHASRKPFASRLLMKVL